MLNNMYLRHLIIHIVSIIFSRGSSLNTFFLVAFVFLSASEGFFHVLKYNLDNDS